METTKKAKPWIQAPNHKYATKTLQKSPRCRPQMLQLGLKSSRCIPKQKCRPQTLQKSPQTQAAEVYKQAPNCQQKQAPTTPRCRPPTAHKQLLPHHPLPRTGLHPDTGPRPGPAPRHPPSPPHPPPPDTGVQAAHNPPLQRPVPLPPAPPQDMGCGGVQPTPNSLPLKGRPQRPPNGGS